MHKAISRCGGYLLDMLFPIECLGCGRNREELPARERWICNECLERLSLRTEQVCPLCEEPSEGGRTHPACRSRQPLDGLWAAAHYEILLREAVHRFKFDFLRDFSFPLARIMVRSVEEAPEFGAFQELLSAGGAKEAEEGLYLDEKRNRRPLPALLVPVPLHRRRRNWRGFNQSFLLAQHLGARFGLPVCERILVRRRHTRPQSLTKSEAERQENIAGAFACLQPEKVRGRDVILVDDICTTAATLTECARELKAAGARKVWGWVVARR